MTAVIIVGFVAAVLILLAWLPIACTIRMIYQDGEFDQEVSFRFGWIKIRTPRRKPSPETPEKSGKTKKKPPENIFLEIRNFQGIYGELKDELFSFFELAASCGVRFQEMKLHMAFGLEDAAQTGIMTGAANGIAYNILGVLDRIFQIQRIEVCVEPDFQRQFINASFGCIACTKIAYIIPIGLKGLRLYRKAVKLYQESRQVKDE